MTKRDDGARLGLSNLARSLREFGIAGSLDDPSGPVEDLLATTRLAKRMASNAAASRLVATNYLFELGPTRGGATALRRTLSLLDDYRRHLLRMLMDAIRAMPDDRALADTIEQVDHLTMELLATADATVPPDLDPGQAEVFAAWDARVWQAPDPVTLLARVVEQPSDFPERPNGPVVVVGFDWLKWDTPPAEPAPAPWGDLTPLASALATVRHPFWGALVATLDACTGDYQWQSLMLGGDVIRSRHRALGAAEAALEKLWRVELSLYPVPPLIVPKTTRLARDKPLPWLRPALDHMAEAGAATQTEGSWRLTDALRTELMKDDEHMLAFEAVRRRSYRLAQAAERMAEQSRQAVTA